MVSEKNEAIKLLDVVALLEEVPEEGLKRGQVGAVVEEWAPGVYEVEFSDALNGRTIALACFKAEKLLKLHHDRVATA